MTEKKKTIESVKDMKKEQAAEGTAMKQDPEDTAAEQGAEDTSAKQAVENTATEQGAEDTTTKQAAEEPADETAGEKKERDLSWTRRAKEKAKKAEEDKTAALIAEANDKYTRLFAEFDNFRKRSEKEKSAMFSMGARDVIEKILIVVDSFERGLATVSEEEKENPFVVGMDKVYKQLMQTLSDLGVTPIEAVGCEFNPDFHNAVMHVEEGETAGENIIVEEFQKGYMYKDTVVRFSMVKVAN
ncbi:MAG: nucleotide exchange factor GrpE [Lachnospiraceae bacterium]|jgi:molecular chaperone GrpE